MLVCIENEKRFCSLEVWAFPGIMVVCDLCQLRGRVKKVKQFEIQFKISAQIENLPHEFMQMCWCRLMMIILTNGLDPDQDRHNVGPDLDPRPFDLSDTCSFHDIFF